MLYPLDGSNEALVAYGKGAKGDTGEVSDAELAAAVAALKGTASAGYDTLGELETKKADLAGPQTHTGDHHFVTQAAGNNSTKAATTAHVAAGYQPIDVLLTQISSMSVTMSGFILFTAGVASIVTLDTDTSLAANSDTRVPSQKAVKAYADALIAANDAMVFKGVIDCSANPNYPAANRGDTYRVSVAGKIGGGSGPNVEAGDLLLCLTDSTASGNHATVGAQWSIIQTNLDGAVIGPASVTDDLPAIFDGTTGKLIKSKTYAAFKTLLTLVKGDVGLGNVDNTADSAKSVSSAATLTTPRNIDGQAFNGSADITVIAPGTHAATGKTTPVDADEFALVDTAASNVLKKLTLANLRVALRPKIVSFTRDLTTVSGTQAVTGVGFTPSTVMFFGGVNSSAYMSFNGVDDGTNHGSTFNQPASGMGLNSTKSIFLIDASGSNFQNAAITSLDADGFTLTWSKTGSPTGTATLFALCFR